MRLVPRQSMTPLPSISPQPAAVGPVVFVPSATDQALTELGKLGELKAAGVLTDEEFATLKARILAD
jgi:hypothetical protein